MITTGPDAGMRQALGTVVFFGMLGVTFFGLFLTQVFFVNPRLLQERSSQIALYLSCGRNRRRFRVIRMNLSPGLCR